MALKKNLTGILLLASIMMWILLASVIWSSGESVNAAYVKLTMLQTIIVIVIAGIYLVDIFCDRRNKLQRYITFCSGGCIIVFSALTCFNVIQYAITWNWMIAFGILFIAFVQIQLLRWGYRVPHMTRYSALFTLLSDFFIVIFFVTKSHHAELRFWVNIAAVLSIVFTLTGLYFMRSKKEKKSV